MQERADLRCAAMWSRKRFAWVIKPARTSSPAWRAASCRATSTATAALAMSSLEIRGPSGKMGTPGECVEHSVPLMRGGGGARELGRPMICDVSHRRPE